jgi:predicted transcriptional regulator
MLSPHEIATLMLVRSAPEQVEMTRVELDTLLDSQFIALENGRRLTLTSAGQRLLEAAARLEEKWSLSPRRFA